MEDQQGNLGLTFHQTLDKVKFSSILLVRRLEDSDEEIPNFFYTYGIMGFRSAFCSSTFFTDPTGLLEIRFTVAPKIVLDNAASAVFLVVSMYEPSDPTKEILALVAQSRESLETWKAPVTRRKIGKPLLGRWVRDSMPALEDLLTEAAPHLTSWPGMQ